MNNVPSHKSNTKMPSTGVFICTTEEKLIETAATLRSLLKHSTHLSLYIALYILGDIDTEPIEQLFKETSEATIEYIQEPPADKIIYPEFALVNIDAFFKRQNRVLYLTPGVEICNDLAPLLQTDLGSCAFAAAPFLRTYATERYLRGIASKEEYPYVDTDVMLIQLTQFRKGKHKLKRYIEEHSINAFTIQDSLNKAYAGKIKLFDLRWNCPQNPQSIYNRNEFLLYEDECLYKEACIDPVIKNHRGNLSPWYYRSEPLFSVISVLDESEKNLERYFRWIEYQIQDLGDTLQVILVSNSSSDFAAKLCEKYPENAEYYHTEKKKPLAMRNEGIAHARGEFLCFFDGEACLSNHALLKAMMFRRKYPMLKNILLPVRYPGQENMVHIPFKEACDAVNPLLDYGFRITEISAILFFAGENRPVFSESCSMKESETRYIWEQLAIEADVGWLAGEFCTIPYQKHTQISYWQEYFGRFWTSFLRQNAERYHAIPYCIQFSFLEELCKAFTLDNVETQWREKFWEYAAQPLEYIEDSVIIDALGMQDMSRILYVLGKKYQKPPELKLLGQDLQLIFGSTVVGQVSYQSVILHFIKIKNNVLTVEGETSLPRCFSDEEAVIYANINGTAISCEMGTRSADKKLLGERYEHCRSFSFSYKLKQDEPIEIRFFHLINGLQIEYHAMTGLRFSPVSNEVSGSYAYREGYLLQLDGGTLKCRYAAEGEEAKAEAAYQHALCALNTPEAKQACRFRRHYFYLRSRKKKQIWLFLDRIDKADDNGEAMFRYVRSLNNSDIEAWFIIDRSSQDYERLKPLGNIVAANSFKHQMLHVLADYIFTSQLNGYVENPFGKGERFYRDLYHQPKVIFLQHGITKDNHTKWLNRYNQNLTALVVSSKREQESFLSYPYYYDKKNIWLCGMPRLDNLYHDEKRQLLIMPTWRKHHMEQRWDAELKTYRWCRKEDFSIGKYVSTYRSLLNNKQLLALCKKYGYSLVFMPHPLVQPYKSEFDPPEEVTVYPYDTSWRQLFAESDLMITDYSSVAFDFAWLEKPVLYYQFDREEFFAGHTYTEGYFDYEKDGFGEIVTKSEELLAVLEDYLKNECQINELYRDRIRAFYSGLERDCCKNIYQKVIESEQTGV